MPFGTRECGTLKASLATVKAEVEAMGTAHAEVAAAMRKDLEEAVSTFSVTMRERRKLIQTNVDKLRRTKQVQEQHLHKVIPQLTSCFLISSSRRSTKRIVLKPMASLPNKTCSWAENLIRCFPKSCSLVWRQNNSKLEKSQASVQTSSIALLIYSNY